MRDWIAGIMAVLGTLLVLAGGTVIVLKSLGIGGTDSPERAGGPQEAGADDPTQALPAARGNRVGLAIRRLTASDRLIGWGILLLVLGAVAAGAISFNLGAEAGTK